ncbi:MAG: hypothetical protein O7E52_02075 [Candidatus Poribacteria bacterium]|nr:hypothetical protein [Candidatus Poribacteria bacterium]
MKPFHNTSRIVQIAILLHLTFYSAHAEDYTTFSLPSGAIARLGKGQISDLAYSPDGQILAVATRVGVWLYDAHTRFEIALLTGPIR